MAKKDLSIVIPTVKFNTEPNNLIIAPQSKSSILNGGNYNQIPRVRIYGYTQRRNQNVPIIQEVPRQNKSSIINPNKPNVGSEYTILDANGNEVISGKTGIEKQKASQLKNVNVGGGDYKFNEYNEKQIELQKTQSKNIGKITEILGGNNKGFIKILTGTFALRRFGYGLGSLGFGAFYGGLGVRNFVKSYNSDKGDVNNETANLLTNLAPSMLSVAIGTYVLKREIGKFMDGRKAKKSVKNGGKGLTKGGIEEEIKGGEGKVTSKASKIGGKLKSIGSNVGKLGVLASGAMLVANAGSTIGGLFDDESKGEVKGSILGGTIGAITGGLATTVGLSKLASSGKGVLAKGAGKVAMKGLSKIVPGAGLVIDGIQAVNYFKRGMETGDKLSIAQGILASAGAISSLVPGFGIPISMGISVINSTIDILKQSNGTLENNTKAVKENTEKQEEKTVTNEEVSSTNMPKRVDESSNTVVSSNTQEESKKNVMSEPQKMYQIKARDIDLTKLDFIEYRLSDRLDIDEISKDEYNEYNELLNSVRELRHAALTVGENGVEADTLEVMSEVLKELKGINANTKQEKVPVRVFDKN